MTALSSVLFCLFFSLACVAFCIASPIAARLMIESYSLVAPQSSFRILIRLAFVFLNLHHFQACGCFLPTKAHEGVMFRPCI